MTRPRLERLWELNWKSPITWSETDELNKLRSERMNEIELASNERELTEEEIEDWDAIEEAEENENWRDLVSWSQM